MNSVNQNKLIGSNRDKHSLIQGLKLTKLKTYFEENNIFSFDMVSQPKPDPEIFLKALEDSKIHSNETIVIEDSVIGVEAAVKALKEGHHGYTPGNGIIELRTAVSEDILKRHKEEINPDQIIIGPGSKELLFFFMVHLQPSQHRKVILLQKTNLALNKLIHQHLHELIPQHKQRIQQKFLDLTSRI